MLSLPPTIAIWFCGFVLDFMPRITDSITIVISNTIITPIKIQRALVALHQ